MLVSGVRPIKNIVTRNKAATQYRFCRLGIMSQVLAVPRDDSNHEIFKTCVFLLKNKEVSKLKKAKDKILLNVYKKIDC